MVVSQVSFDNKSVEVAPSILTLENIFYNDFKDGQIVTRYIEVDEDHIDINLKSSPVANVEMLKILFQNILKE